MMNTFSIRNGSFAPNGVVGAEPAPSPYTTKGPAPSVTAETHTMLVLTATVPTPDSFAPFGTLLTPEGRHRLPINTYGDKLDLYREEFESDMPIEWFIVNGQPRWNGVIFLERHRLLSQTFIPVNGCDYLTVLARPDAVEDNGFPVLEELKAFRVPGDMPIQLHRGTWHENPMPLRADTRLLVTSHANLTLAHRQDPDPRLAGLPLDLERRWYKAAGFDVTIA